MPFSLGKWRSTLFRTSKIGLFSAYIGRWPAYIQEAWQAQEVRKNFFEVFRTFFNLHNLLCPVSLGIWRITEIRPSKNPIISPHRGLCPGTCRKLPRQVGTHHTSYLPTTHQLLPGCITHITQEAIPTHNTGTSFLPTGLQPGSLQLHTLGLPHVQALIQVSWIQVHTYKH